MTRDFTEWWMSRHNIFGATKEGRIYCREGRGLTKKFYEEGQVMLSIMRTYFSNSSVACKLHAGNEPDDAVLMDSVGRVIRRIQITFAEDSKSEHLRTKELSRTGSVAGLVKPVVVGRGKNKTVTFPAVEAIDHRELVAETLDLIRDRVLKKNRMGYGPNVTLAVGFDDALYDDGEDIISFQKLYDATAHPFHELIFAGIKGQIVLPPCLRETAA
ncbi:MAG TPA: hypothetical protein VD994_08940 [Prosthecobacter sp.]|nr:hypothetical protein [Prosthecobacter sp.]